METETNKYDERYTFLGEKLSLPDEAVSLFNRLWPLIATFSVASIGYILYIKGFIWFSWHPVSMILAFVLTASNAVMLKKIGGYANTVNHGILMGAVVALATFGFYTIYTNKVMFGKDHFTSAHGVMGTIVVIVFAVYATIGALVLNPEWGYLNKNRDFRFFHKWCGRILLVFTWITCFVGFGEIESGIFYQILFALPLTYFGYKLFL